MNERTTRVGLIEDHELVRRSYSNLLESCGFETGTFDSAESFLADEMEDEFDCLVVDLRLPGISGCQLIQLLRQKNYQKKIILVSGNIDVHTLEQLDELEGVETLRKPCAPAEFVETVTGCIREQLNRTG